MRNIIAKSFIGAVLEIGLVISIRYQAIFVKTSTLKMFLSTNISLMNEATQIREKQLINALCIDIILKID
jgi:outer membrane protein W